MVVFVANQILAETFGWKCNAGFSDCLNQDYVAKGTHYIQVISNIDGKASCANPPGLSHYCVFITLFFYATWRVERNFIEVVSSGELGSVSCLFRMC